FTVAMRLPPLVTPPLAEPPPWPPLLATRGRGAKSAPHAHHGMHVVLAVDGELRLQKGRTWRRVAGVVTPPDVPHAIDGADATIFLVFLDPESDAGQALRAAVGAEPRALTAAERDALLDGAEPLAIMREGG